MKKLFCIALLLLVSWMTSVCGEKTYYSFIHPVDEIESVEIVSAENSLVFAVTKTLSETEKSDFLQQFQSMKFGTYYVGDPMGVHGKAVKLTYRNGDYEMICYFWAEYVKNSEIYFTWKHCDEAEFHALLDSFLE